MARGLRMMVLGAWALSLAGCYVYHTTEEGDLAPALTGDDGGVATVPDPGSVSDAGVVSASDANVSRPTTTNCALITDPIQQLLCRAQQPSSTGTMPNIQDVLGDLLGQRRDAGTQIGIEDLLDELMRGMQRDGGVSTSPIGGLGSTMNCRNPTDPFTRLLCGVSAARDGGAQSSADVFGPLLEALSRVECEGATEGLTVLFCFLRDLTAGTTPRDAGFSFPGRNPRAAGQPDNPGRGATGRPDTMPAL